MEITLLYEQLQLDRPHWQNEEEVRKSWLKHLENILKINFHAERSRNDASYNQVIIEFKSKGLFKGSIKSKAFKEAIYDRLKKYIEKRSDDEGLSPEDYIGIAIDGEHICFAFYKNGGIKHRTLLPFNEASVRLVAQACADSKRRAVTAENLAEDFGNNSEVGISLISDLTNELVVCLKKSSNNKIKMLFEEWRTIFGQVADLSQAQTVSLQKQISVNIPLTNLDSVATVLFVIHTYNAFVIKLIAAEIISEYGLTSHPDFCEHLLSCDDQELLEKLDIEIEQSKYFEAARIKGFVEEAVFSWYTDKALSNNGKAAICTGIRLLLSKLSLYRMDDLNAARSKDVLKLFYQDLVPEALRKALGEFYTPDWLVDVTCDQALIDDWYSARVLDPTCGSGSFLLECIRRKRSLGNEQNRTEKNILQNVLKTVWGFDLNPLAVQSSRVNYLIAIADLVSASKQEVELPVLLADAVYSPAHAPQKNLDFVEYVVGGTKSDLHINLPWTLAYDRKRLDGVFEVMGESVILENEYDAVEKILLNEKSLSANEADEWREALKSTYDQVLALHKKSWNGIWFRIVRNFFWSAVAGEFDAIVGNPPWVRWSNLPERYRDRIKPTCEQYSIFSETPYHGGNELDISGMLTYTVGDKWLKNNGSLTFVITQTHFQSPSSQGFRDFKINEKMCFIPIEVNDLKKLKPFPKVANKTAIMSLKKAPFKKGVIYPVPYNVWEKADNYTAAIPETSSKQDVYKRVNIKNWEATPVSGKSSPWAILPKGRFKDMAAIQGKSEWIAGRKGITTDLNGVYMVRIVDTNHSEKLVQIETRPEAGRSDIGPSRRFWVEPDLLFPLLKGAGDFSAYNLNIKEELYVFLPNEGIVKAEYAKAETKLAKLKKSKAYLSSFKKRLLQRSTYKQRQQGAPFYSIYNVGTYTLAPYKVAWAELSTTFEAVVVKNSTVPFMGNRPYVPDHKIYFSEFQDGNEAYFVCSLLNSSLVKEYVESHTIEIQVSNIFKHIEIPRFDSKNSTHTKIVKLSKKAHSAKSSAERIKVANQISSITEGVLKS